MNPNTSVRVSTDGTNQCQCQCPCQCLHHRTCRVLSGVAYGMDSIATSTPTDWPEATHVAIPSVGDDRGMDGYGMEGVWRVLVLLSGELGLQSTDG